MQKLGVFVICGFASISVLNGCTANTAPQSDSKQESPLASVPKDEDSQSRRARSHGESTRMTPYVFAAWRKCADEHQRCQFIGTHTVAYGAGDQWFYRTATNGINCNNETFGDPAFGIFKACYITD